VNVIWALLIGVAAFWLVGCLFGVLFSGDLVDGIVHGSIVAGVLLLLAAILVGAGFAIQAVLG
jgi:hypothetical protein